MSLPKKFLKQLPIGTDQELYDLLAHQDDYLPEAVAAAKEELSKRNLAPEIVARLEATVKSQQAAAEAKAQERLSWPMRIFLFIFGVGFFGALLAVYYSSKGYEKKSADCWITLGVSMAFYVVTGVLLSIL